MTAQWGEITVEEIIAPVKGKLVSGSSRRIISGINTDSRDIKTGQLFIALKGENFDGHDFVNKAIEKGASAAIVERGIRIGEGKGRDAAVIEVPDSLNALGDLALWWKKQFNVTTVSITGSMGKTTTKEMASTILELEGDTLKSKGNFNNLIGLPLTLFQLNGKQRHAVLEMGMNRPGEIGRLTEISDPDIGLITNVGRVHLEGLGNVEGVARAKTEMLEVINSESTVILNGDDKILMGAAKRFNRKTYTYGTCPDNDIRADKIDDLGQEGSLFEVTYEGGSFPIGIRVPGYHNILNAIAASAIAICMGISVNNITRGLNKYKGTKGRLIPVTLQDNVILLDDTYNSNPSSLGSVLQTVKKMAGDSRRIIIGLGEMLELGEEAIPAHLEAGEMVAETGAGYFLAMGEHARYMLKGAIDKGFPSEMTVEVKSHQDMVNEIKNAMKKDDLILLKGSRRIGLDRVVQDLREKRGKEEKNGQIKEDYGRG
jgi:UDP-N-acetylmuramoyl-tripeptide--D-alanyl-D-alanine ligase